MWLAPVQVSLLAVADRHEDYAHEVAQLLRASGLRVEVVASDRGTLGARIREAKTQKVPYVVVVGDDDVQHRTVGVNTRGATDPERGVPLDIFREQMVQAAATRRVQQPATD